MNEVIDTKTSGTPGHRRQLAMYLHGVADRVAALDVLRQLEKATDEDFVANANQWIDTLRKALGGIPLDWPGYWTQCPVIPTREMAGVIPYSFNGGMLNASTEAERLHFLQLAIAAAPKPVAPIGSAGDTGQHAALQTFTVLCVDAAGNHPTTHFSTHVAPDIESAKDAATAEAAADWKQAVDEISVLGVLAGDVDTLEWNDESE